MNNKLVTSLVVKLTKFKRSEQIRQGVADRYPRNAKCLCGSKLKYKKCCWSKGNAPGNKFHSHLFFKDLVKQFKYTAKKYRKLTNDDSSALQET